MDAVAWSFILYTAAIMACGVYSARYSRNTTSDFFLADRGLSAWVAALSSSASAESGWVTLGLVGMAYSTGVGALWIIPGTVLAFLFNWFVLAEPLRRISIETGAITFPEVLAVRFRGRAAALIRLVAVAIILSMLTAYVAAQFNAAGKAFRGTFEWSYAPGVWLGFGIVAVYTLAGGFRAVAWTDVVQACFMVAAVIVLPIVLIADLGGPGEMWSRLQALEGGESLTDGLAGKSGIMVVGFLAVWFGIPLGYPGQPHILLRCMATRDRAAVRRAGIISTVWVLFLFAGAVMLGIAARAAYGLEVLGDPEQALPHAALDLLPAPLAGVVIAAVLAAICSTADSQLLVSASTVSHDLYAALLGRKPSEQGKVLLDRAAVALIAIVALVIALGEVRVIFDFVLYAWDGLGASFGPALILVLLWKRATGWGVLAGMAAGVTTAVVWRETLHPHLYSLIPAFAAAMLVAVVVSLATRASDPGGRS